MFPLASFMSRLVGFAKAAKSFIINLIAATSTRNSPTTGTTDGLLVTYPANTPSFYEGDLQNYDAGTNYLINSLAPATQTTASLATGFYTLSVYDAGSALASGGTATIVGPSSATEGSPDTFEVTVAGTVTVTKTGVLSRFQLEGGSVETPHIITAAAPLSRNADFTTVPAPSVLTPESWAIRVELTPALIEVNGYALGSADDSSNRFGLIVRGTAVRLLNRMLGVTTIDFTSAYTPTVGVAMYLDAYGDSDGAVCGIRGFDVGAAEPAFTTAPYAPIFLNSTLAIGGQGTTGFSLQTGEYGDDGVPVCYASKEAAGW